MKNLLFVISFLCLSACAGFGIGGGAGGSAAKGEAFNFTCDDGKVVTVRHPDSDRATLTFDGRRFDMYRVVSGSGARFATESGLSPDSGLTWWEKGDQAVLQKMVLDHTADPSRAPLIATCKLL